MSGNLVQAAYVIAAVLFVMSLAGLSKHETSKSGLTYGIVGMGIALVATIALVIDKVLKPELDLTWLPVLLMAGAIVIGALIGFWRARIVEMTGMPELIALLHSFVGLAAVLIGWNGALEGFHADGVNPADVRALTNIHEAEIAIGIFIAGLGIVLKIETPLAVRNLPELIAATAARVELVGREVRQLAQFLRLLLRQAETILAVARAEQGGAEAERDRQAGRAEPVGLTRVGRGGIVGRHLVRRRQPAHHAFGGGTPGA